MLRITIFTVFLYSTSCAIAAPQKAIKTRNADATANKKRIQKPVVLKVGDKAPLFSGTTDRGKPWKSKDHVGKKILVVYFYPADMTPGCTKQACRYRDAIKRMEPRKGEIPIEVIGVSGDSVENHKHFRQQHKLNFALLADPKGEIAKAFGVKTGKGGKFQWQLDGRPLELIRGVTASRWTFVIGPEKNIAYKNTKVNPTKDTEQVLKVIAEIKAAKQRENK